jgi:hypothetical protein
MGIPLARIWHALAHRLPSPIPIVMRRAVRPLFVILTTIVLLVVGASDRARAADDKTSPLTGGRWREWTAGSGRARDRRHARTRPETRGSERPARARRRGARGAVEPPKPGAKPRT